MNRFRGAVLLAAVLFILPVLAGCERLAELFSPSPVYEVVFDKDPQLALGEVRAKGVVIGEIAGKELAGEPAGSLVLVKIRIDGKYKDMMRQNVVFVSQNGALEYQNAGAAGAPLESGARVLGFANQGDFFAFQAKSLLMDWSGALMDELRRLMEQPKNKGQGGAI